METRYGWVANIRRKWYGIEAVRLVGQKVGFHRSFDFRSPVSCPRADRFEGWASRERTRPDNGPLWRLPPAPPAAVTWRSSWSNNRMNLVICHYSFSLKASLHSKEKAHVQGRRGGRGVETRNISQVKLLGTKSWSLSNNRGGERGEGGGINNFTWIRNGRNEIKFYTFSPETNFEGINQRMDKSIFCAGRIYLKTYFINFTMKHSSREKF